MEEKPSHFTQTVFALIHKWTLPFPSHAPRSSPQQEVRTNIVSTPINHNAMLLCLETSDFSFFQNEKLSFNGRRFEDVVKVYGFQNTPALFVTECYDL